MGRRKGKGLSLSNSHFHASDQHYCYKKCFLEMKHHVDRGKGKAQDMDDLHTFSCINIIREENQGCCG